MPQQLTSAVVTVVLFIAIAAAIALIYQTSAVRQGSNIGNAIIDYVSTRTFGPIEAIRNTSYVAAAGGAVNEFLHQLSHTPLVLLHPPPDLGFWSWLQFYIYHPIRVVCKGNPFFSDQIHFRSQTGCLFWESRETQIAVRNSIQHALGGLPPSWSPSTTAQPQPPPSPCVIHFRCSDVPFIGKESWRRFYWYKGFQLPKIDYYLWALDRFYPKSPAVRSQVKIQILSLITWESDGNHRRQQCAKLWRERLRSAIIQYGGGFTDVEIMPAGSAIDDFRTLFTAPRSIGTCGTFSFTALIGRPENTFALPNAGYEDFFGNWVSPPFEVGSWPSWMYTEPSLLHSEVVDYYDAETVADQLFKL